MCLVIDKHCAMFSEKLCVNDVQYATMMGWELNLHILYICVFFIHMHIIFSISDLMAASNSCTNYELWWTSLAVSSSLYVVGIATSIVLLVIHATLLHRLTYKSWIGRVRRTLKQTCQHCTSVDHFIGRIMTILHISCNVAYCTYAVYRLYQPVIRCFDSTIPPDIILEILISIFLGFFFFIRFLATNNVALFWFSPYTIVDIFTIPTVYTACVLHKDWINLRPLRFIWLIQISDILKFSRRIRSTSIIDIAAILLRFTCIWLTASGIICVLETTGDPWKDFKNFQTITFREYTYYIMVTMSTVGYGDYSPKTAWGQTFITFFIIAGLAIFAVSLPVLVDPLIQYYRIISYIYFDNTRIQQHVLVCGHINATSAHEFLKEFLHPDHGDKLTHVLFIDPRYPDPDLKAVISKYNRSHYLLGSVLSSNTLQKAKIKEAKACIILANRHYTDHVAEDSTSMFYLVAIKNARASVPVIIQVLSTTSKDYISAIPGWDPEKDVVLCLNELRLGMLALSASCPGASTLVANLFYACGNLKSTNGWKSLYLEGAGNELYEVPFSHSFEGMMFWEAVKVCYDRLSLVLIGLKKDRAFHINPSRSDVVIHQGTLGYFIGKSFESVQIVSTYCIKCHDHRTCKCNDITTIPKPDVQLQYLCATTCMADSDTINSPQFYMLQPQQLSTCILTDYQVLRNHIILCVFALDYSAKLGLHNFVAPLRSKNIPSSELKPIVIVSHGPFIEKEWLDLCSFPLLYIIHGSPLDWKCLSKASIQQCSSCFLVTAPASSYILDHGLHDKEAILCSLSLQKKLQNSSVLVVTDLVQDSNVQFLDFSDEDTEGELYQSEPFAWGNAFAASVFNSVTTTAYHRPGTIELISTLISPKHDDSSRILPIRLNYGSYDQFSELYVHLLEQQVICIALYRQCPQNPMKSYVITNPAKDLVLDRTDTAIVITPCVWTSHT